MNTPNKKLMQELIAKLEGWMDLQFDLPQLEGLWGIPPMGAVSLLESGGYLPVPNLLCRSPLEEKQAFHPD